MSALDFDYLRRANVDRCTSPTGFGHDLASWSPLEWAGAMCGEAGEAANIAKKMIRIRDGVRGNRAHDTYIELAKKLGREVADTVIYADLVLAATDQDLGETIRQAWNQKSIELGWPYRI